MHEVDAPPRSRLEQVALDTDRLCDGQVSEAILLCAQIAQGRATVSFATRRLFGDLAAELSSLHSWRQTWLSQLERGLAEIDSGPD